MYAGDEVGSFTLYIIWHIHKKRLQF